MDRGGDSRGELYRVAVELSPSGMLAVDGEHRILLVNRQVERMFGYSRDELIGEPIDLLVPQRFRAAHPALRDGYQRAPSTRPMGAGRTLTGQRKDGSEVPVEIGLSPVETERGVVILASVVDISERRRIEHQLRQAQKMEAIGTLARGVAHDFNNVLMAIVGYTELAKMGGGMPGDMRVDLDEVLRAAERGRRLVQRILAFSRESKTEARPVNCQAVLEEATAFLRGSLPTTIEIVELIAPNTPPLLADETQLHQVIMNLAMNAAHAMQGGGRLELRLEPHTVDTATAQHWAIMPGPYVRLTVKDQGKGMTEEVWARIFEPFFTTKPSGEGTGLGLSVVHGIVQGYGGTVRVESLPGRGSAFEVYLPASVRGAAELPKVPDAGQGPRVLIVEDEPPLATMMQRQLANLGYSPRVFLSSVDAYNAFRQQPDAFELVITDNTMPNLTGLELAQRLRALRPELPILLVSGIAATLTAEELASTGVTAVLPKPHSMPELQEVVSRLVPPRPSQR